MKRSTLYSALLIFVTASSVSVAAENNQHFYIGGAVGEVSADINGNDSGALLGLYGGYNFNRWLGLEANLVFSKKLDINKIEAHLGSLTITPTFSYHVNDYLSFYSKIGIASMALELKDSSGSNTYSDLTWTYGIGASVELNNNITTRLSYDFISGNMESDDYFKLNNRNFDADIKQLMLGIQYNF